MGAGKAVPGAVEGGGIFVQYASTVEGKYRMLAGRRADLIIEEASLASPKIEELNLTGKIIRTRGIGSQSGFHILIGKKSSFAPSLPRLDATLKAMTEDGTIRAILENYGTR